MSGSVRLRQVWRAVRVLKHLPKHVMDGLRCDLAHADPRPDVQSRSLAYVEFQGRQTQMDDAVVNARLCARIVEDQRRSLASDDLVIGVSQAHLAPASNNYLVHQSIPLGIGIDIDAVKQPMADALGLSTVSRA